MKKYSSYLITILLLAVVLWHANAAAQDYTTWGLPSGATARLGKGEITGNIAFSPDGTRLAVATSIGIWIYDVRTNKTKPIDLLIGHTESVTSIAFSPHSTILASGSDDGTVRLWDVITGLPITTFKKHHDHVTCVAFSPDGNTLATGGFIFNKRGNPTLLLWDIPTKKQRMTLKMAQGEPVNSITKSVRDLAFSPDGNTLASLSDYENIRLWDIQTGRYKILDTEQNREIVYIGFSPDGNTIATGSWDNTVKLWDANTKKLKNTIKVQDIGGIASVALSPDGNTIATGGYKTVRLWDANTGEHKNTFKMDKIDGDAIFFMAFSPDGNTLATLSTADSDQNTIILWDTQTEKQRIIRGHTSAVTCLTFSPDGNTIATGNIGGISYLWDANTKKRIASLKGEGENPITFIEYTPDGNTIVTASQWDGTVRLWDTSNRLAQTHIRKPKTILTTDTPLIVSMAYSSDGKIIATASGKEAKLGGVSLWRAQTGQKIATLKGQKIKILYTLFSPDGTTLATAHDKEIIQLWNVQTKQIIATLKAQIRFAHGYPAFTFSPDGTLLAATGITGNVQVWDTNTHKQKDMIKTQIKEPTCIRFSPDGTIIATGHPDGTLLLYHRPTQEFIATFKGHTTIVNAVTFSPNGDTLATASDDGTILLWTIR